MKIVLVLSALIAFCAADASESFASAKISNDEASEFQPSVQLIRGTYETPLDHFSPTDNRRLRLTYSANIQFFEGTGPLFFFIDDGRSRTRWIERGLVFDLARETGGALITASARYWGRNRWGNSTIENLRHMTLDHILADIPHLVVKVKEDLDARNARVVVWGSRLGGTIAALARKKFPHIIHGVWSSSGIFRAVSNENEAYNTVAWNIRQEGQENCTDVLASALEQLQQLVVARDGETLQRLFNLCAPIEFENPQEVTNFYEVIFHYIEEYIDTHHYAGIRNLCTDLVYKNDPLKSFGRWVRFVFGDEDTCTDVSYATRVASYQDVACNCQKRAFAYFHCTQNAFRFHVTNDNGFGGIFPNVVTQDFWNTWCSDIFGDVFNRTLLERAANNFNLQHGSQSQVIRNAIFSIGNLDPYFYLGISEYDIHTSEAVITRHVSSFADLDSISTGDSTSLSITKRRVLSALTRFALPDDIPEDESSEEEDSSSSEEDSSSSEEEEEEEGETTTTTTTTELPPLIDIELKYGKL